MKLTPALIESDAVAALIDAAAASVALPIDPAGEARQVIKGSRRHNGRAAEAGVLRSGIVALTGGLNRDGRKRKCGEERWRCWESQ